LEKSLNEEGSKVDNYKYTYDPSLDHTISTQIGVQGAKWFEKFTSA
jgi:hypothetical protein